jgi:hypothetical protein
MLTSFYISVFVLCFWRKNLNLINSFLFERKDLLKNFVFTIQKEVFFCKRKKIMVHEGSTLVWTYKILHRYPEEQLRKFYGDVLPPENETPFASVLAAYVNLEHNCKKKAGITQADFDAAAKGTKITGARLKTLWFDLLNGEVPDFFSDTDDE